MRKRSLNKEAAFREKKKSLLFKENGVSLRERKEKKGGPGKASETKEAEGAGGEKKEHLREMEGLERSNFPTEKKT